MSTYVPVDFEDGVTPLNAATFNHLEDEVELLDALKVPDPTGLDEKWLKAESGAMVWVDAPTGGGGAIEYENAWAAGTAYQAGDVVIHEGVEYLAVNPSTGDEPVPAAAPSPVGVIPLVTALPASPFDGQEVVLVDSLTAPTYSWRLRYNAGSSSSYKWEFVGGTDAYVRYSPDETTATASTWLDLATVGPRVIVPCPGDYDAFGGSTGFHSAANGVIYIGIAKNATTPALSIPAVSPLANQQDRGLVTSMRLTDLIAGDDVRLRYYNQTTGTAHWSSRWLRVTPVRLA